MYQVLQWSTTLSVLMAVFPGGPGLGGTRMSLFSILPPGAKWLSAGDNWSCKTWKGPVKSYLYLYLSLSVLTAIFQVNLVSRCLLKQRMMEVVVTTGAISRAKLQSNHRHQQTNITLLQAGCPSCHPTNSVSRAQKEYYDQPLFCELILTISYICSSQTHNTDVKICTYYTSI